jgi:hypothetical protein
MRPQRILIGAGLMALMLGGEVPAGPATAIPGSGEASGPTVRHLPRLAQRGEKWTGSPEPDPGGLPGYRKEAPSAPAARPMVPETRGGPQFDRAPAAEPGYSASSKSKEDKSKDEPK